MSSRLRAAEQKWGRSTKAAFSKYWADSFKKGQSYDAWAKGIADFLGISVATVKKSLAAQNFRAAQRNAGAFRSQAMKSIEAAIRTHAWSDGMKRAFGAKGSAGGTARKRGGRKKGSTSKKKTTTKKKTGGRKSNKKTYGTKKEAQNSRKKGQSVYKVKGGYRLSKKPKKK